MVHIEFYLDGGLPGSHVHSWSRKGFIYNRACQPLSLCGRKPQKEEHGWMSVLYTQCLKILPARSEVLINIPILQIKKTSFSSNLLNRGSDWVVRVISQFLAQGCLSKVHFRCHQNPFKGAEVVSQRVNQGLSPKEWRRDIGKNQTCRFPLQELKGCKILPQCMSKSFQILCVRPHITSHVS